MSNNQPISFAVLWPVEELVESSSVRLIENFSNSKSINSITNNQFSSSCEVFAGSCNQRPLCESASRRPHNEGLINYCLILAFQKAKQIKVGILGRLKFSAMRTACRGSLLWAIVNCGCFSSYEIASALTERLLGARSSGLTVDNRRLCARFRAANAMSDKRDETTLSCYKLFQKSARKFEFCRAITLSLMCSD